MLIFTVIMVAMFGIVYVILARSFVGLAISNRGVAKVKYKEKAVKAGSVNRALFDKEMRRFLGSPTYMLNCGLGILVMPIVAIVLFVKGENIINVMNAIFGGVEGLVPMLACAAICMSVSMNDITAPSVSLEGKNLWLVQVFPVSGWQVLMAKLNVHLVLTLIPALILTASVLWIVKPGLAFLLLIPIVVVLFVLLMAEIGLVLNLKMPNLTWTDEVVPVKQSMGVMLTLFGGWILVMVLGGIYWLLKDIFSPLVYMICVACLLLAASMVMLSWLRGRGAKIFEAL